MPNTSQTSQMGLGRVFRRIVTGLSLVVLMGTSGACGDDAASIESPVNEEQVTEMADNALEAFNTGDYSAWSRDWSDAMKAAIDADAFISFRDQFHATLGDYQRIVSVTGGDGSAPGTYRWTFDIEFENAPYRMWFGFKKDSPEIEGVSFEEPST